MEDRLVNHATLNNRLVLKFCRERKRYLHSIAFYYKKVYKESYFKRVDGVIKCKCVICDRVNSHFLNHRNSIKSGCVAS